MTTEEKAVKDAELNAIIEEIRQGILTQMNDKLALANDAGKTIIQSYIDEIASYTVPDITKPRFPGMPKIDSEGNVSTVNSSGSAPNVIA